MNKTRPLTVSLPIGLFSNATMSAPLPKVSTIRRPSTAKHEIPETVSLEHATERLDEDISRDDEGNLITGTHSLAQSWTYWFSCATSRNRDATQLPNPPH
jgi:hypothetical protein